MPARDASGRFIGGGSTRTFQRDPHFAGALLRSRGVADVLEPLVAEAARRASDLAPDDPATGGEDLHSSIVGEVAMTPSGWAGRVTVLNFKAPWFEQGAEGTPARPFLRPAVEQVVGPIVDGDGRDVGSDDGTGD